MSHHVIYSCQSFLRQTGLLSITQTSCWPSQCWAHFRSYCLTLTPQRPFMLPMPAFGICQPALPPAHISVTCWAKHTAPLSSCYIVSSQRKCLELILSRFCRVSCTRLSHADPSGSLSPLFDLDPWSGMEGLLCISTGEVSSLVIELQLQLLRMVDRVACCDLYPLGIHQP